MGKNVLLVEDDDSLLRLETLILSKHGYAVLGVKSGRTALAVIAERKPDIVLLDVLLPDMDGYSVCREIRNNPETASIPVIFLTARNRQEDQLHGLEAGGNHYIGKPFKMERVLKTVDSLMH